MVTPTEINRLKRDGHILTADNISELIGRYVRDEVPDYQMAAFLMAVCCRGMDVSEVQALTKSMLNSGIILDFSYLSGVKVDKHSTGGVGDKTSLVLAPVVAAAGVIVPMISGRGLGYSGGTLDKLESIPEFRTDLSLNKFRNQIETLGVALIGQTKEIVPADKKLYALRDVTGTVESIPLITASIMSKKLAEGIDALLLDIKSGNGAFMKTDKQASELLKSLVMIGQSMGKKVKAIITDMNQPLGWAVGNSLEVIEAQEMLRGNLKGRFAELTLELASHMIYLGQGASDLEAAKALALKLILSGQALEKWRQIVTAQGGNPNIVDDDALLPQALYQKDICSQDCGIVTVIDTEAIGRTTVMLGAGRQTVSSQIDHSVGLRIKVELGDEIQSGSPLCTVYYNDHIKFESAIRQLQKAFVVRSDINPKEYFNYVPSLIH